MARAARVEFNFFRHFTATLRNFLLTKNFAGTGMNSRMRFCLPGASFLEILYWILLTDEHCMSLLLDRSEKTDSNGCARNFRKVLVRIFEHHTKSSRLQKKIEFFNRYFIFNSFCSKFDEIPKVATKSQFHYKVSICSLICIKNFKRLCNKMTINDYS